MKLKRSDIQALAAAFQYLDGRQEAAKDADGRSVVVVKPYDLPVGVRYAIGRNLRHLKPALEAIQDTRTAIIKKHSGNTGVIKAGTPEHAAADQEIAELLRGEDEVEVHRIKVTDLNIGTNQIAGSVIEALLPILDGEI